MKHSLVTILSMALLVSAAQSAGLSFDKHTDINTITQDGLDRKFIKDLSAVEVIQRPTGKFLVLACDEGCSIQIARVIDGKPRIDSIQNIQIIETFFSEPDYEDLEDIEELDFEALAVSGDYLAVAASASLKRKKPKGKSVEKDREKMITLSRACKNTISKGELEFYPSDLLFVLKIGEANDKGLSVTPHKVFDVRRSLAKEPTNGANPLTANGDSFFKLPSKDNGIDVEGLTIIGDEFLIGLRGPVLRGHALVVAFPFSKEVSVTSTAIKTFESTPEFRFLNLLGLGIRGLETVNESVFIIAGPTMDLARSNFAIFKWDGKTETFKQDRVEYPKSVLEHLYDVTPNEPVLKPESLAYDESAKRLYLYCDGDSVFRAYEVPCQ